MALIGVNVVASVHYRHWGEPNIASEGCLRVFAMGTIRFQALAAWKHSLTIYGKTEWIGPCR